MGKIDFDNDAMGKGSERIGSIMAEGASTKGKRKDITPAQAAQLKADRKTRGHKGIKGPKICIVLSSTNYDFIRTMATVQGISQAQFVNDVLDMYREQHGADFNELQKILNRMQGGND